MRKQDLAYYKPHQKNREAVGLATATRENQRISMRIMMS